MSYTKAKKIFNDNFNFVNADSNPPIFNLNAGLIQLTEAIENDFTELEQTLHQIATRLQHLEKK